MSKLILYKTAPHRTKRSSDASFEFITLFFFYCCLLLTVLVSMNPTTRQRFFSRSYVLTCEALVSNSRSFRKFHSHGHYFSDGLRSRRPSAFIAPNKISKYGNSHVIPTPMHVTALLAATSAKSRGRRSKSSSTKGQYSLVIQGPPGFSYPPSKGDRPFKLVIVESPSKCKTISKILQEYVKENNLGYDFVLTSSMGHGKLHRCGK